MSSSTTGTTAKICFNSNCKDVLKQSRKGWRLRTGESADLCDRCASAYEEGRFCETFHLNASGWRCCESCGKRVHCGCIVSFHMFVLLDAGGIECITCARKSFILTPNPAWPPHSLFNSVQPERAKDLSVKNWSQIVGSGHVARHQAPNLFSTSHDPSKLLPRILPFADDIPSSIDGLNASERLSSSLPRILPFADDGLNASKLLPRILPFADDIPSSIDGLNASERLSSSLPRILPFANDIPSSIDELNASERLSSSLPRILPFANDIPSSIDELNASERLSSSFLEKKKVDDSSEKLTNGSLKLGTSEVPKNGHASEEQLNPHINVSQEPSFSKDPTIPRFSLVGPPASPNESNDKSKVLGIHAQRLTPPPPMGTQMCGNNRVASTGEAHKRNGRPRGDARGRNKLLPRYWPRISDQELQQISGDSNSVITPLFQKMLSASDAGRIGRLVLPKKCAEAYFPPISHPEGVPLKVLDLKGEEWVFQFRFWPNNNSRMYVLEGVTPCIQLMHLQAGDVVTFSRLEPEGKLVMGFRKASNTPSDQVNETFNASDGVSINGDVSCETKTGKVVSTHHHSKEKEPAAKSSFRTKRKNSTQGLKSKRQRIDNEDLIELNITTGQAQGILRPPPKHAPSVVVIEGFELEEYEDAPIIGRPTIFPTDHVGEKIQWAQCEDCYKWRKIPADALLPSRWTCSQNSWDQERSLCLVAQELTAEQLDGLIPTNQADAKKMEDGKQDPVPVEALESLDRLANLAIQDDGESLSSSSQATTKHPRHRPGCTCIVCIQPPSGKGPKHKQTCTCNVCLTVKRRAGTLMLRREQKQSEKESESSLQNPLTEDYIQFCTNVESSSNPKPKDRACEDPKDDDHSWRKSSLSPFKTQIDLNIQPERDEELSPGSDSGGMMRLIQDGTGRFLRQQRFSGSVSNTNSGAETDLAVAMKSASASER